MGNVVFSGGDTNSPPPAQPDFILETNLLEQILTQSSVELWSTNSNGVLTMQFRRSVTNLLAGGQAGKKP